MMMSNTLMIGAVAAGLLVPGGAATTVAAAPDTATTLSAFSAPLDNDWNRDHNRDNDRNGNWDHHRDWNGDRRRNDGWQGHPWRWWHDWGISADTCRDGGGHVNWNRHQCNGGRFDDFHIR